MLAFHPTRAGLGANMYEDDEDGDACVHEINKDPKKRNEV